MRPVTEGTLVRDRYTGYVGVSSDRPLGGTGLCSSCVWVVYEGPTPGRGWESHQCPTETEYNGVGVPCPLSWGGWEGCVGRRVCVV